MIRSANAWSLTLLLAAAAAAAPTEGGKTVSIKGTVNGPDGKPMRGVMMTVIDEAALKSVSVFSGIDGGYTLPAMAAKDYKLRARLQGFEDETTELANGQCPDGGCKVQMRPAENMNLQRTSMDRIGQIKFADEKERIKFRMTCTYCHQIGSEGFRSPERVEDYEFMLREVMAGPVGQGSFRQLPKPMQEKLSKMLFDAFHQGAEMEWGVWTPPPAPEGDALKAVITEWGMGQEDNGMIHDLEPGKDGRMYTVDMIQDCLRVLDPRTDERKTYAIPGGKNPDTDETPVVGPHSIEADADGNMWMTLALGGKMAKFDVKTEEWTVVPSAENGRRGGYPHTLRLDQQGVVWYTDAAMNSVFSLDPKTMAIKQYKLLAPNKAENVPTEGTGESGGIVPYGIDVAPDGRVWYTKLNGRRVGMIDPKSGEIKEWIPPVIGPRRHAVGADGLVWVPGFGTGNLCSYDPAKDEWKTYDCIPGKGDEIPYALNVDRKSGMVWICGTSSDTMLRFDPKDGETTVYRMPSHVTYTREVEFTEDGMWTCNSNFPVRHIENHFGSIIRVATPKKGA